MDAKELKPCPFCGKSDAFVERLDHTACFVQCEGRVGSTEVCGMRGPIGVQEGDDEEMPGRAAAVRAWNERAALPSDAAQAPICWITKEQLGQIEDLTADAWVYWRETGHVAESDEVPLYAAPVAPAAAAPDTADTVFRRCLDLEIQNLTVNGNNEITWMAISCRGVLSSLQSTAGAETEDADRYRWLRTHRLFPSTSTFSNAVELDTAIDAARKVRKPSLDQPTAWVAHDTQAARDVLAERVRQVIVEGWTPMHDDQHADGDLALAASVYAASAGGVSWPDSDPYLWPWDRAWWKPTTPRRDLVKAAALIIAEIERIDRAQSGDEEAVARKYVTQPGESVMGIALRQCGDEKAWRHILACNPKFSRMLPHEYFPVGTILTLPAEQDGAQ